MDPAESNPGNPFHPYTELRNRLSELFLAALAAPDRGACVLWLHTYLRLAQAGTFAIPLPSLAEAVNRAAGKIPGTDRRGPLGALLADFHLLQLRHPESDAVYRGAAALQALRWSAADAIELQPEFRPYMTYAAQHAAKFWGVLGPLMQGHGPGAGDTEGAVALGTLVFNAGLFFEYHELLEGHWRNEEGDRKRFLQGLIQVAVGLHHREHGNYRGAVLLLREGAERLAVGRPSMLGLDVEDFSRQVHTARAALEALGPPGVRELSPTLLPKQRLRQA
jgi:hypothetical protein